MDNTYTVQDLIKALVLYDDNDYLKKFVCHVTNISYMTIEKMAEEERKNINTQVEYFCRDIANFKTWRTEIIRGILSKEDIQTILDSLDNDTFFVAEQVGLNCGEDANVDFEEYCGEFPDDEDSFTRTTDAPTTALTAKELVENFRKAKGKWNISSYI